MKKKGKTPEDPNQSRETKKQYNGPNQTSYCTMSIDNITAP